MSTTQCPDLEALFVALDEGRPEALEHVHACPACSSIVEAHRQLEKDLLRFSDPLPPPDFVQQVMAKVEKTPVPVRREVWTGLAILVTSLAAGIFVLVDSGAAAIFGAQVAQSLLWLRSFVGAAPDAFRAVWTAAGVQVTFGAALLLIAVLFGLKRLAGGPIEVQVSA